MTEAGEAAVPGEPRQLVEHLFRRQHARLVARLTAIFGARHLELAEDVVQEALARALASWPFQGVPDDPEAWLVRVAKNLALDALRQHASARREAGELDEGRAHELELWAERAASRDPARAAEVEEELVDDALRLVFTACHPALALEDRVALTLKVSCGFGTQEIARALLASEAAIAQRLLRAKRRLEEQAVSFDVPAGPELARRLDGVLEVLYLVFNEGYGATRGQSLVRRELVEEGVRLAELLLARPELARPEVAALCALFRLQGARLAARTGEAGELLTLGQQDRARWDRTWIAHGLSHFERSIAGPRRSAWHLEAAIALEHARAPSYAATDWGVILRHYDALVELTGSATARLNRAVARAKLHGPAAALEEVAQLAAGELADYAQAHATLARLAWSAGDTARALTSFARALALPLSDPEQHFLADLRDRCRRGEPAASF